MLRCSKLPGAMAVADNPIEADVFGIALTTATSWSNKFTIVAVDTPAKTENEVMGTNIGLNRIDAFGYVFWFNSKHDDIAFSINKA